MTPQDFRQWLSARYPEGQSQEKRIALFQREFEGSALPLSRATIYKGLGGKTPVPPWVKLFSSNKKKGK